jgi:hypothetical protein
MPANDSQLDILIRQGYRPDESDGGVDLSLIRWMLSLTPLQRLEVLQQHVDSILEIRKLNAR